MDAATHALPAQRWVFRARCLGVVDGDTIDVRLDLGLHSYRVERLRLAGVNCPEMHGAERDNGIVARAYTVAWVVEGQGGAALDRDDPRDFPLLVQTYKADAFGRYLALVWRLYDNHCLGDDLLAAGHAVEFMVGPVTPGLPQ